MEGAYLPNPHLRGAVVLKVETWVCRMCNSFSVRGQQVVAEKAQNLDLENPRFKC